MDYLHAIGPWYAQFQWNIKKEIGGSSLLTVRCHALDGLRWFVAKRAVEVFVYSNFSPQNPARQRSWRRNSCLQGVAFRVPYCAPCSPLLVPGDRQEQNQRTPKPSLLKLTTPRHVLPDAQTWEGNEFPHTMSVLEWKRGGYRYWGWYGLNEGRGIGLARSNDLVNWTKYEKNPLWTNARWPSGLEKANPKQSGLLYFAITRNYDTPNSHIVLATSRDGINLTEDKVVVQPVANQRNQNPNLFRDPRSARIYLTYFRGKEPDQFEIVSRNATAIEDLDKSPEKVLIRSTETVAAPTLLYVKNATGKKTGIYYLATEIYPHRYTTDPEREWQVKVFAADSPDGDFQPVVSDPCAGSVHVCSSTYFIAASTDSSAI